MSHAISDYLNTNPEPYPDQIYGDGFRCSAYLTDGTFLPCVMLRKSEPTTTLALRRFKEEKKGRGIFGRGSGYEKIVRHFLVSGNRVNHYDITKIEASRFAIPLGILEQIRGETTMGWTGFVLEMRDGQLLQFGTTFEFAFFSIPENYFFSDVVAVHNHSWVSKDGKLRSLLEGSSSQPDQYNVSLVNRERPYFICHFDA